MSRKYRINRRKMFFAAALALAFAVYFYFLISNVSSNFSSLLNDSQTAAQQARQEEEQEQEQEKKTKTVNKKLASLVCKFEGDNDISRDSIAFGYFNFDTGVSYTQNGSRQMVAASTYKLPLNMYMTDLIREGKISRKTKLTFTQDSYEDDCGIVSSGYSVGDSISLDTLMESSIVVSDNNASKIMIHYLGGWADYVKDIQKYSDEDADKADYDDNNIRVNYMMDVLRYLYQHRDNYSSLISDMKEACSEQYLQYSVSAEVAHKYGNYETAQNDVGIVYADSPYAVAVYTDDVDNAEYLIGDLNEKLLKFTETTVMRLSDSENE